MKRFVLIFVLILTGVGSVFAQASKLQKLVKIESNNGTIGSILEEIANSGGFFISYGQDIPHDKQIKLKCKQQTVQQFLDEMFGKEIYCVEYGNKILLRLKQELSEEIIIRGKVVESDTREPLPGVTIYIPGTDPLVGVVSNVDGYFRIKVPPGLDIIKFTCIGYEQLSILSGENIPEYIELDSKNQEIAEVVIEYYTIAIEEKLNISVGNISEEILAKLSVPTIENALQGTVSGIHAIRNSGMPGASLQVKIRGLRSLINSEPAYYLNGIPVQRAALHALSPNDLESIKILKDASSTSLYGCSAGNGLVLLNSKQASDKRFSASLNYYTGQQELWKNYDVMSTSEFNNFFKLVRPTSRLYDDIDTLHKTDWLDQIFHKAKTEEIHFSLSGRNQHSGVYFSTGYFRQSAMIKNLDFKRYTFNLSGDHAINPKLKIEENLSFAFLDYTGLKEGSFLNDFSNPVLSSLLMLPFYHPDDSITPNLSRQISLPNPLDDTELTGNSRKNYIFHGNIMANYKISKKFSYDANFGFELYSQNNISYNNSPPIFLVGPDFNFYKNEYSINDLRYDLFQSVNYSVLLSENHILNTKLGFDIGQNSSDWIPMKQTHFESRQTFNDDSAGYVVDYYPNLRYKSDFRHYAIYGSIDYSFKSKYYFNLGIRKDEVAFPFNDEQQKLSAIFPSFSLGWIFSREKIFSEVQFLQYGKLRYGWGKAGNSPGLNYSYYANMMRELEYLFAFNSESGIANSAMLRQSNEHFYWENESAMDLGLDLGLFNNKVFLTIDYYINHLNKSETYPADNPLTFISELSQRRFFRINYTPTAEILNSGIECDIRYKHSFQTVRWDIGANISHTENKILDIGELPISYLYSPDYDLISANIPGEPAGSFYGYKIERLFVEEDAPPGQLVSNQPFTYNANGDKIYSQIYARPGDYKFADINNDSIIDYRDKTIIGNPFPKFTFGFYCNLQIKNFDLSIFFQGTYGNDIFNATKLWLYNPYGQSNWSRDMLNSYRAPRYEDGVIVDQGLTDTELHQIDFYNRNFNLRVSDFYIEDGSYLRLKNMQVGYTINPSISSKIYIQKFRIYISTQNLFTITNYSGLDPEVGGWGVDCGIYPQPRTYLVGLNLEF